jgi:transglutaminase-like putative cysteine protease
MGRKKELYIIIIFLISLSLFFGSIQYNFSEESDELSPAAWNNSYNNSTGHGNFTLQLNNSTNQTIVTPINQTIINDTTAKNQIIPDIIFDDINISLNLFTAAINPPNIINTPESKAAAGDPTNTNGTLNQTGELLPIKVYSSLTKCLKSTANAQSNDPNIKALAKKITKGAASKYEKAVRIFNWVRDNLDYSFYYNTKYGAVKTLKKKTGNCVDMSHLLVALSRAAGIPARYVHVTAEFTSGHVHGHVFVQVYIKGKWYNLDASNNKNFFNVINNWYTATAKIKGVYASLPF